MATDVRISQVPVSVLSSVTKSPTVRLSQIAVTILAKRATTHVFAFWGDGAVSAPTGA